MAMTEGNVMINANPPITRNVRTALLTHCADSFTMPIGQHPTYPQAISKRHNCDLPQNLAQALDQAVAHLDPRMAAAIFAMQPKDLPQEKLQRYKPISMNY